MSDKQKILFSQSDIQNKVDEIALKINADYKDKQNEGIVVVSILKGSVLFTADLIRKLNLDIELEFMTLSSYGNKLKSSGKAKIVQDINIDVAGKHVIIVEDLIDTGLSLKTLIEIFKNRNAASVEFCVLLDKHKSGLKVKYPGFDCPDKFVLGYGIDAKQKGRNYPDIRCL